MHKLAEVLVLVKIIFAFAAGLACGHYEGQATTLQKLFQPSLMGMDLERYTTPKGGKN